MNDAVDLSHEVSKQPACEALGVSRATFYRQQREKPVEAQGNDDRPAPPLALNPEKDRLLVTSCTLERFQDKALMRSMLRCWMKDNTIVRSGPCTGYSLRNMGMSKNEEDTINNLIIRNGTTGYGLIRSGTGISQTERRSEMDLLLPLCDHGHLQPLRRGLDGCPSGTRCLG